MYVPKCDIYLFSVPALDCSRTLFLAFNKYQTSGLLHIINVGIGGNSDSQITTFVYYHIHTIYRVSRNNRQIFHEQVERTKLNRKVLYHFVSFPNS